GKAIDADLVMLQHRVASARDRRRLLLCFTAARQRGEGDQDDSFHSTPSARAIPLPPRWRSSASPEREIELPIRRRRRSGGSKAPSRPSERKRTGACGRATPFRNTRERTRAASTG